MRISLVQTTIISNLLLKFLCWFSKSIKQLPALRLISVHHLRQKIIWKMSSRAFKHPNCRFTSNPEVGHFSHQSPDYFSNHWKPVAIAWFFKIVLGLCEKILLV